MAVIKVVEDGMSVYRASQEYGVLRSTLYDSISGRVAHGINPGPKPYLSFNEEKELGKYLKYCAKVRYGKARKDAICIVESAAHSRGVLRSSYLLQMDGAMSVRLVMGQGDSTAHVRMEVVNKDTSSLADSSGVRWWCTLRWPH